MPIWAWMLIIAAIVLVIGIAAWAAMRKKRSQDLRQRFGPEYDRTMREEGSRRAAESELSERRKRREQLDIRPLPPEARQRYAGSWRETQGRFVDDPGAALAEADVLVISVMRDRGYPMEDFERRSADISVDHPRVVDNYRAAHGISMAGERGVATTEDMRQAMVHYRALFDELLGDEQAEVRMREAT